MKKRADNALEVSANMEVILLDGSTEILKVAYESSLSALAAMGHLLQEDLCEELLEQVNQEFNRREDIVGCYSEYISVVFKHPIPNSNIELYGSEFIPKLRGIHGIT